MSITRSLLNEFRPLFQMLDDPIYAMSADPFAVVTRQQPGQSSGVVTRSPHVHLTEEDNRFVVEAEVPGVPKENLDISIGDNGRSLTIKGNTFSSSEEGTPAPQQQAAAEAQTPAAATPGEAQVSKTPAEGQPGTYSRWSSRSSFARTIWLPRPVDAGKVAAKLDHGVLTLEIPKLQATTQRITIA